ncbi:hypothetical protein UFOVP248_72 [uncultured Caudovirales phage]|uniref:Uncharacterized protein n=1 Tax=uncultured Caudovirales phage TaxID=2100421 RepID=A0A6J5LLU2_9CAUD|nr:hypothetical protein UFOVP248_72 [uncultured Caudovirales phage]
MYPSEQEWESSTEVERLYLILYHTLKQMSIDLQKKIKKFYLTKQELYDILYIILYILLYIILYIIIFIYKYIYTRMRVAQLS